MGKVYRRVLKVIKHILLVAKAARLVPSFTIFTGKNKNIITVKFGTHQGKGPRELILGINPLGLHRETYLRLGPLVAFAEGDLSQVVE